MSEESTNEEVAQKPRKIGRPSKRTAEMVDKILHVIGLGLTVETAAKVVGIHRDTIYAWCKSDEEFSVDLKKAQNQAKVNVAGALMTKVELGDLGAICFWLKTRTSEFRERRPDDAREIGIDLGSLDSVEALKIASVRVTLAMARGEASTHQGEKILAALDQVRKTFVTGELAEQLSEILKAQGVDDTE